MSWSEEINEVIFDICTEIGKNEDHLTPVDDLQAGIFAYLRARNSPAYAREVFDKNQDILSKKTKRKTIETKLDSFDSMIYTLSQNDQIAKEFYNNCLEQAGLSEGGTFIFNKKLRKQKMSAYLFHIPSKTENINYGHHESFYGNLWEAVLKVWGSKLKYAFDDPEFKDKCVQGNYFGLNQPIVNLSPFVKDNPDKLFNLEDYKQIGLTLIKRKKIIPFDTLGNLINEKYQFPLKDL